VLIGQISAINLDLAIVVIGAMVRWMAVLEGGAQGIPISLPARTNVVRVRDGCVRLGLLVYVKFMVINAGLFSMILKAISDGIRALRTGYCGGV
jgi:hypothetical protein